MIALTESPASHSGQCGAAARLSVDTPQCGATLGHAGRRINPDIWHRRNESMTWGLLGLVVLGGSVIVALLVALVWYCILQIAKW